MQSNAEPVCGEQDVRRPKHDVQYTRRGLRACCPWKSLPGERSLTILASRYARGQNRWRARAAGVAAAFGSLLEPVHVNLTLRVGCGHRIVSGGDVDLAIGHDGRAEFDTDAGLVPRVDIAAV